VAEQLKHHDGNVVLSEAAFLVPTAPLLLLSAFLEQPVDGDGVDLELDRNSLKKSLSGDGDLPADAAFRFLIVLAFPGHIGRRLLPIVEITWASLVKGPKAALQLSQLSQGRRKKSASLKVV
jgi:hypothetical protein